VRLIPSSDLISVFIPAYNREKTIKRALKSVINQTYTNLQIIVVDDCSSDNTIPVIDSILKLNSRITLLKNETNQGPNFTRNRGIKHATGKFIILLDSDDDWELNTLELLWRKIITTDDRVGLVYSGMNFIQTGMTRKFYPKYRGEVFLKLMTQGVIGVYPLIKKKVFEKTGLFDEHEILRRGGHQDYEMWIRIAHHYKFEYVSKPLLNHYYHKDSITYESLIKKPFTKIYAYIYIWRKYKEFIGNNPEVYIFYCYKIFELLCLGNQKTLAKKVIFSALKTDVRKLRTYYHLVFYLHDFFFRSKAIQRIQDFAITVKEFYGDFDFLGNEICNFKVICYFTKF